MAAMHLDLEKAQAAIPPVPRPTSSLSPNKINLNCLCRYLRSRIPNAILSFPLRSSWTLAAWKSLGVCMGAGQVHHPHWPHLCRSKSCMASFHNKTSSHVPPPACTVICVMHVPCDTGIRKGCYRKVHIHNNMRRYSSKRTDNLQH